MKLLDVHGFEVDPIWVVLTRIADALDRAYPNCVVTAHPPVSELFDDPKADPIDYIMDTYGETRADAEAIVATTAPQQEDDLELHWLRNGLKN